MHIYKPLSICWDFGGLPKYQNSHLCCCQRCQQPALHMKCCSGKVENPCKSAILALSSSEVSNSFSNVFQICFQLPGTKVHSHSRCTISSRSLPHLQHWECVLSSTASVLSCGTGCPLGNITGHSSLKTYDVWAPGSIVMHVTVEENHDLQPCLFGNRTLAHLLRTCLDKWIPYFPTMPSSLRDLHVVYEAA